MDAGDATTDAAMNVTFISIDGLGTEARYLCSVRNRGHGSRIGNPHNYRIGFRSDEPWKDISALKEPESFARYAVSQLPKLVDSEITTLSICDLRRGTRRVISNPDEAIAPQDQHEFNRLIHQHPLVRFHSSHPGAGAWRISDSLPMSAFRQTAIYNDYYHRIGINHVLAVPIIANREPSAGSAATSSTNLVYPSTSITAATGSTSGINRITAAGNA